MVSQERAAAKKSTAEGAAVPLPKAAPSTAVPKRAAAGSVAAPPAKKPTSKKTSARKAAAAEDLAEPVAPSARKPQFSQEHATMKKVPLDASGSGAAVTNGGALNAK